MSGMKDKGRIEMEKKERKTGNGRGYIGRRGG